MKKLLMSSGPMLLIAFLLFVLGGVAAVNLLGDSLLRLVFFAPALIWFCTGLYLQSNQQKVE